MILFCLLLIVGKILEIEVVVLNWVGVIVGLFVVMLLLVVVVVFIVLWFVVLIVLIFKGIVIELLLVKVWDLLRVLVLILV